MSEEKNVDNAEVVSDGVESIEVFLYCDGMINFGDVGALYTETPEMPKSEFNTYISSVYDEDSMQKLAEDYQFDPLFEGDVLECVGADNSDYCSEATFSYAVENEETPSFSFDCMTFDE